ncbi:hypothetical protein Chor_011734 [Crotalus horridus]
MTRTRWYCLPAKIEGASGVAEFPAAPAPSRALKAGSLPRLVRHLLEAPALGDAGYRPAFLATYRSFAQPSAVLELLLERWASGVSGGGLGGREGGGGFP